MNLEITGGESAKDLIKELVHLRLTARVVIRTSDGWRKLRAYAERQRDNAPDAESMAAALTTLAKADEAELQLKSAEIEIGRALMPLCDALDRNATREQIFEALNVNPADRDTDMVRQYGDTTLCLITVLHLENSAMNRREDFASRDSQPLQWCHTMAFMRELKTNAKFDRIIHDGANEFFNGVFGEYRERPLMERLAGRAV